MNFVVLCWESTATHTDSDISKKWMCRSPDGTQKTDVVASLLMLVLGSIHSLHLRHIKFYSFRISCGSFFFCLESFSRYLLKSFTNSHANINIRSAPEHTQRILNRDISSRLMLLCVRLCHVPVLPRLLFICALFSWRKILPKQIILI